MSTTSHRRLASLARFVVPVLVAGLALAFALPASALTIAAQGRLASSAGGPVADGFYAVKFKLYASKDAAAPVWDETWLGLQVQGGLFSADLGSQDVKNPLVEDIFLKNDELWVTLQVSVEAELPRVRITAVPYAVRALAADKLLGTLPGSQIADGTVAAKALDFGFAGSTSKGGAAGDLACTGCVGLAELAPGVLDAKNVAYAGAVPTTVADTLDTVSAQLDKVTALLNQFMSTVDKVNQNVDTLQSAVKVGKTNLGLGKVPAATCGVDLASDGGPLCIDGQPATVVRSASNDAQMAKLAAPGQIVLRTDTNTAWMSVGGTWRKLQFLASCGDKAVDAPETCDDGNQVDTDACVQCQNAKCGDGQVQSGVETCDGTKIGSSTCASVLGGAATGKLGCAADCKKFDTSGCVVALGTDTNPAQNCKAILDAMPASTDGAYFLTDGKQKFKAYCDMAGGGWTLASNWNYSDVPEQWGTFLAAVADPKPSVKHALPFQLLIPAPKAVKLTYTGNGQALNATVTAGTAWEKSSGKGARLKLQSGLYLVFDEQGCGAGVDTATGLGVCFVNGAYGNGFLCDGDSSQWGSGSGLFNQCTGNENGCSNPAWGTNGSVQVCGATALLNVWLR